MPLYQASSGSSFNPSSIASGSDVVQLGVRGHTVQTNPLGRFQTAAGLTALQVNNDLSVSVGGALVVNGNTAMGFTELFGDLRVTHSSSSNPTALVFRFSGAINVARVYITGNMSPLYVDNATGLRLLGGNLEVGTVGRGLRVAEGADAKQGIANLAGGVVTVPNTRVTANSRIFITSQSDAVAGALRVSSLVPGVSFTVRSSNAAESGIIAYQIFEPA